eukprot:TRINITY_DN76249_c0_g1_i1.p1 TRINITY_DN76249_c0_g1~~TRINITY_DN76249_c0_g1_i1.p1  ORF type:complete len:464 (-),score=36.28 TRINITY_DN76249_c0_g1_i1:8-1399(-)
MEKVSETTPLKGQSEVTTAKVLARFVTLGMATCEGYFMVFFTTVGTRLIEVFDLNTSHVSFMMTMQVVGAIVGVASVGMLISSFGCRLTCAISSGLLFMGQLIAGTAPSFPQLVAGLTMTHLGMNIGLVVCVVYLSEVTSAPYRGTMVSAVELCINAGHLLMFGLVVGVDVMLPADRATMDWRIVFFVGAAIALILFIAAFFMHESPRYLQKIGKIDEAASCLAELLGKSLSDPEVQTCLTEWRQCETPSQDHKSRIAEYKEIVTSRPGWAAMAAQGFQTLSGIVLLVNYSGMILEPLLGRQETRVWIAIMGIGKWLGIFIAIFFLIERVGRRPLLLGSSGACAAVSLALAIGTWRRAPGEMIAIFIGLWWMVFSMGLGPVPYVYSPEILPNHHRSAGMTVAKGVHLVGVYCNLVVGLWLMKFSLVATMCIMVAVNVVACSIFYVFCPETQGRTLEQIEKVFD